MVALANSNSQILLIDQGVAYVCPFLPFRLLRNPVVYLTAIHAHSAAVIEQQSMEPRDAAHRQRLLVEHLSVAVNINDRAAWIREHGSLALLDGERRDQVVRGKGDGVGGENAVAGDRTHRPVDGLRHQSDRGRRKVSRTAREGSRMSGDVDILAGKHVGRVEAGHEGKLLQVFEPSRDLEDGVAVAVRHEIAGLTGRPQVPLVLATEAKQTWLAGGRLQQRAGRHTQIGRIGIWHRNTGANCEPSG